MPFAGFKDFDDCVTKQMDKGNSREAASRICGAIKRRVEGSIIDESLQAQFNEQLFGGQNSVPLSIDGSCPEGYKKVGNRCAKINDDKSEQQSNMGGGTIMNQKRGDFKMLSPSDRP